jgi:hypothetical protein
LTHSQRFRPFKTSRRVVCTAATILALTPAQALACPVCALVGSGDNTWAYNAMSVMLIVLPLGMIGGAVLWLSRMAALADRTTTEHVGKRAIVTDYHVVQVKSTTDPGVF